MKKQLMVAVFFMLFAVGIADASELFYENFETDLSRWTGKENGAYNGQIVTDPFDASNNVLNFKYLNSAGDIFTKTTFTSSTGGNFILSFDYLGLDSGPGSDGNLGGFIGYSDGLPGNHVWLGGTGSGYSDLLPDTGKWEHIVIPFLAGADIRLMLEDFSGSSGIAGDAYFDNIRLTDSNGNTPEPATMLLLGIGIIGLEGLRKSFYNRSIQNSKRVYE